MTQQQQQSYLGPFITLVVLFFFVGFLTSVNGQFQGPLKAAFLSGAGDLKNTFATLITFSWFLAYPLTGGIGSRWVSAFGYKGTLIRALIVLVVGLGVFLASSSYTVAFPESKVAIGAASIPVGYFIFLLGSFVVGSAVTILQVVINPYLTACHVKGTQAVQRLNIGGSSNSIGTTLAPYFVSGVVFGGVAMEDVKIAQLQVPFIVLIGIIILVALVLTRMSLPDIQGTKVEAGEKLEKSVWSFSHLTLGVIAIFFYVGVEVAIGVNINLYAQELIDGGSDLSAFGVGVVGIPALMATLYWGGMLVGRLISSGLSNIAPQLQLSTVAISAIVLTTVAMIVGNPWFLVGVGLFHSVMWGAIFTLSVSKLGKYTAAASGVFMIGVVGGAIIPLLQGFLADTLGAWHWTWTLVLIGEAYILYYALIGHKVKTSAE